MSTPHDYYHHHGSPDLHNTGESRPYLDPDYVANGHGAQLPALSAIGRGPRGEGLYIDNVVENGGTVSFGIYSSLTGELVWQSPNLAAPTIWFEPIDFREVVPGTPAPLDICVSKGGVTNTVTAYMPPGERGSLVYLLDEYQERTEDDTYVTTINALTVYGRNTYLNKPVPKPNDVVFFKYTGQDEYGFAFGTIEAVGDHTRDHEGHTGEQVVFTARTFIPLPPLEIGQNGNWIVGGQDSGIKAQGDKGDKGDKGDRGQDGQRGLRGERGPKGDAGARGEKGKDGKDGKDGKPFKFGVVTTAMGDPGTQPSAVFRQTDIDDNVYDLTLTIPRGEDGAMIDVQNGIYTTADLPEFTPTPVNTAFVVDDGNGYDLYIRGRIPVDAEDGGPWVVIENLYDYDHISNAPLKKSQDGTRWISQQNAKLPVEWGTGALATLQGSNNVASGDNSHAEGFLATASGEASHAEGKSNRALGNYSHAEGNGGDAEGVASHKEGSGTWAIGNFSHSEGSATIANGIASHAEGSGASTSGAYAHAEGAGTQATGEASHAEGGGCRSIGKYSHAEGSGCSAEGESSHAEGSGGGAYGKYSHKEGSGTFSRGDYSHAEGSGATAAVGATAAHAEGSSTTASGEASHAEGSGALASGAGAHAEGQGSRATGLGAHAEGGGCLASGVVAHAEGAGTQATAEASHAEGHETIAASANQHVSGKYNTQDANGTYAEIVGNGTASNTRANARTLDWNGNAWHAGEVTATKSVTEGGVTTTQSHNLTDKIDRTEALALIQANAGGGGSLIDFAETSWIEFQAGEITNNMEEVEDIDDAYYETVVTSEDSQALGRYLGVFRSLFSSTYTSSASGGFYYNTEFWADPGTFTLVEAGPDGNNCAVWSYPENGLTVYLDAPDPSSNDQVQPKFTVRFHHSSSFIYYFVTGARIKLPYPSLYSMVKAMASTVSGIAFATNNQAETMVGQVIAERS